jgi:hypothetical protein
MNRNETEGARRGAPEAVQVADRFHVVPKPLLDLSLSFLRSRCSFSERGQQVFLKLINVTYGGSCSWKCLYY